MQQSKYIKVLQTLGVKELKAFNKYFHGLYGGKKKLVAINNYVQQFTEVGFVAEELEKEYIKTHSSLGNSFGKKGLGNPLSELTSYLEEFLRWKKINKEAKGIEKDRLKLAIYKERGLGNYFVSEFEVVEKKLKSEPLDMWQHFNLAELYSNFHYSAFTEKFSKQGVPLAEIRQELIQFYQNSMIKIACELKQREDILSEDNQVDTFKTESGDDFYKAYHLLLELINKQEESAYKAAKSFILSRLEGYSKDDQSILLTHLINFCIKSLKEGALSFGRDIYDLYKMMVKTGLVFENGAIDNINYTNILELACKYEEKEWAKAFMEKYKHQIIPEKLRNAAYKIGIGILDLAENRYSKVIKDLNNVSFSNSDHALKMRWLLLAAHFEHHPNSDIFINFCDAYEAYFRRNTTLNEQTLRGSLNYLKFIKKINRPYDKTKVFQEVLSISPMVYRLFVLRKIDPTFMRKSEV